MADKNQLKIADQVDLADDDPFAELTRIMGFDPRQPARQAQQQPAAPEPAPTEQAVEEDDFSLDLEKELLGEFALEDETSADDVAAEAAAPAFEATHADAPEVDFDFSTDFEVAMAASSQDEVPAASEAEFDLGLSEDEVPAASEAEFDLGLSEDDVRAALDQEFSEPAAPAQALEDDFDLGLTEDDVSTLDAGPDQVAAETAPALSVNAGDIDADLDAAMADIDMDFGNAFAAEPVEAVGEVVEAVQDNVEPAEADLHLFEEADFRLGDELAEEPAAAAVEPQPQPEIDESAFSFGEDEFRLDDTHPVEAQADEAQAAEPEADDFSFDDLDLAAEDFSAEPEVMETQAVEPEMVESEAVEIEASALEAIADELEHETAEPSNEADLPHFEFSVPRYEPRKLPVSPMDVAAEEFRQREAAAAATAPEFNLEDELNALLGNIRSGQALGAQTSAPASPVVEAPEAAQPAAPEVHEPAAYEADTHAADSSAFEPSFRPEPISFDAPEHPVDIADDLRWDLDDAFTAEVAESTEEDQPGAYASDGRYDTTYGETEQPEAVYGEAEQLEAAYEEAEQPEDFYADGSEAEDELPPLDFDDLSFDPDAEDTQSPPSTYYGEAIAGAAIGAAASHFGSSASARLSDLPRAPVGEHFAERQQAATASQSFSPHRDPVVRGNPMKEDPLDVITQLAEKYSKKEPTYDHAMGVARGSAPFADDAVAEEDIDISSAFEEQPEVETVDVADQAVALADDLDIPELVEEDELPPVSAYDDLDAEFSSLLNEMNAEPANSQAGTSASFEARPYESQMSAALGGSHQAPASKAGYDDDLGQHSFALDVDDLPGSRPVEQYAPDDYDYDPDMDQEIAQHLEEDDRQPRSRGMLIAALVGGVALLGGIGAFAFSFGGGSDGDAPALVRADEGPVKVKPENPGGTTVPNQDSKVYETVAGEGAVGAPQQEKLVTTAEEPVDVTPPPPAIEDTALAPSGKSEDRIEQIVQEAENQTDDEIVGVAPRKVRTMVVKPDGTLVPREDEVDAGTSNEQTETIAAAVPQAAPAPAIPEATGALPAPDAAAETALSPAPAPEETAAAAPSAGEETAAAPASGDRGAMPDTAPIAPLRPADQPIDVVGEVKPDQVAAATTAAANGSWAMQIASQPSEAAAQSSYQDLVRRYGSVLQGKEVNIVKAEIAGKGTFWRVRVPAATRNEAISLCENYKSAGGNCFVSR